MQKVTSWDRENHVYPKVTAIYTKYEKVLIVRDIGKKVH